MDFRKTSALSKLIKDLNGIFPIYKESGITSAQTLNKIRQLISKESGFNLNQALLKIGHGGTLDKQAEGVLVVGMGKGCKRLKKFLHGTKEYEAVGRLGIATDNFNHEGKIEEKKTYEHVKEEDIQKALVKYIGRIEIKPPKYSALKIKGRRMSDLAVAGIDFEPEPKAVEVHKLSCVEFNPPLFKLDICCGGGFYVRSLIHYLAKDLGTCAHMVHLLRKRQGPFHLEDALLQTDWNLNSIITIIRSIRSKTKR